MAKLGELFSSKRNQIIAVVVAIVVIVVVVIALGAKSAACSGASAKTIVTGKQLTDDPGAYKCKVITLSGQIFNTEKKDGKNAWQVWTDPENSENGILVYYDKSSSLSNNDYITFTGRVGSELTGQNAFGGDVSTPTITATSVTKTDRDNAVAPALKIIMPNVSQTVSGITVTVTKLEFAASETRLYIQVKNDSPATASIYSFDTKMVQGSSQIKTKDVFDNDTSNELASDIVAHTTEKGEMYFEKADPSKPLIITLEGMSQTDYQDLSYSFTISP